MRKVERVSRASRLVGDSSLGSLRASASPRPSSTMSHRSSSTAALPQLAALILSCLRHFFAARSGREMEEALVEGKERPTPPWWPPRPSRDWEIPEPCSVPPPDPWDVRALLEQVPPPAWPSRNSVEASNDDRTAFELSGEFLEELARGEKKRKESRRKEKAERSGARDAVGSTASGATTITPQGILDRRRRFELSEALQDILDQRKELREFRETLYGEEGLHAVEGAEDRINEAFDALCATLQAPAWPTPRLG